MSEITGDTTLPENENGNQTYTEGSPGADDAESRLHRSSSVLSVSSIASSASGIPVKKSGIRPPSRIGRPCDGQQQKPAVPTSPTHNYDINRIANNFGRYTRLSDVLEEDSRDYLRFTNMPTYRRRYSSTGSSSSSMDHLWELYPHRLREAGLSRLSDSSAVLTEDTDSFIIGQRVWVGGTKPGTIAFIGETQFAPGEWAGIALDEAIGKNDGCVAGMRYFQCEPKKGVFSRLTRLTRVPLEEPHNRSYESFSTPSANGVRSPISPTGSTRSLLKSPVSYYASNTSLASTSTSHIIDYKLGDRVIIKSSQGSKVGTVRYIGYTEFAPGEWVGVELDDPRGKNDGSVDGKRYFACQSNFGLFAPTNKVSKSPSKIKPGACAVHNNSGLPPSGMRKATSRESMASATSSIRRVRLGVNSLTPKKVPLKASTPMISRPSLQDVVKEKQQHIDQLLKERDLERQEFTKAASQAEEAEQQFLLIKNEFDAYRSECEVKLQEHITLLAELKKDRTDLLGQLEDEKKKNEDLLFKFEEAAIIKSDLEIMLENKSVEIKELGVVRESLEEMEKSSNKLFEAEESLIKANEEIDKLKANMELLSIENKSFLADISLSNDKFESLQKELEVTRKQLEELNNTRNDLSQKFTALNIEHTQVIEKVAELQLKLESTENQSAQKDLDSVVLKSELESTKQLLLGYEKQLAEIKTSQAKQEVDLSKEIEKLKMELSSRCFDLETINEKLKQTTEEMEVLTKQSHESKLLLETKINSEEVRNHQIIEKLTEELNVLRKTLQSKNEEVATLKKSSEEIVSSSKTLLDENDKKLNEYHRDKELLRKEVEDLKHFASSSSFELQEQLSLERQENSTQIENLQNLLKNKEDEFNSLSFEYSSLRDELAIKSGTLEKELVGLENLKTSFNCVTDELTKLKDENKQMVLDNGDLKRTNESLKQNLEDMEVNKKQMNEQIQSLINSSGDNSAKLEEMHANLTEKQTLLEKVKQEYQEKIQVIEHELQKKILKLKEKEDELSTYANELNETKNSLGQTDDEYKQKIDKLVDEMTKLKQIHEAEIAKIQDVANEKHKVIEEKSRVINDMEIKMQQQIDKSQSYVDDIVGTYDDKINILTEKNRKVREDLEKKICENEKLNNDMKVDYEEKLNQLTEDESELKNRFNVISKENDELKIDLQLVRSGLQEKSNELGDFEKITQEKEQIFITKINDYETAVAKSTSETLEKINILDNESKKLQEELKKKNEELDQLNTKFREYVKHNETNLGEKENHFTKKILDLEKQLTESNANFLETNEQKTNLERDLQNKDSTIEANRLEIEDSLKKLKSYQEKLSAFEKENLKIQEALNISTKKSAESDEELKKLNSELESLNEKYKVIENELKEEKCKIDSLQKDKIEKDEIVRNNWEDLASKLEIAEKHTEELTCEREFILQSLQQVQFTKKQKSDLLHKVSQQPNNNLSGIFSNLDDNYQDDLLLNRIEVLETSSDALKTELNNANEIIHKQKTETASFKEQLKLVQEATNQISSSGTDNSKDSSILVNNKQYDYQQLIEDKILAENQVKFLNSIIVDMQKKNEEQQVKIEILESGYSPAAAEELHLLGYSSNSKQLPPRMFCDICDRFDEHETEDCPRQTSEDMPPPPPPSGQKKEKPAPRPYCELCEMFGHDTQDCQEDDTF